MDIILTSHGREECRDTWVKLKTWSVWMTQWPDEGVFGVLLGHVSFRVSVVLLAKKKKKADRIWM